MGTEVSEKVGHRIDVLLEASIVMREEERVDDATVAGPVTAGVALTDDVSRIRMLAERLGQEHRGRVRIFRPELFPGEVFLFEGPDS